MFLALVHDDARQCTTEINIVFWVDPFLMRKKSVEKRIGNRDDHVL